MVQTEIPIADLREKSESTEAVELLFDSAFIRTATDRIKTAKKSIYICAYAWRWYENAPEKLIQKFNYEVARAAALGLDIRAILDQRTQATLIKGYGINTRVYPTDRALHTKAILVDDNCLLIGSHNLTERGTAENYEISVAISEPNSCLLFKEYFLRMWGNYAEQS